MWQRERERPALGSREPASGQSGLWWAQQQPGTSPALPAPAPAPVGPVLRLRAVVQGGVQHRHLAQGPLHRLGAAGVANQQRNIEGAALLARLLQWEEER